MAAEIGRTPIITYAPQIRSYNSAASRTISLRLIDKANFNVSKKSYETSLARALESKKYWDELLERLRKAGGGGGGSRRFDKIASSMMFINYLSSKTIHAMIKNFNTELLKVLESSLKYINKITQNSFIASIMKTGAFLLNISVFFTNNVAKILNLSNIPKSGANLSMQFFYFAGLVSFQLNKLKDILEEESKEALRKLDLKEKIKKIKAAVLGLFIELKDEVLSAFEVLKTFFNFLILNQEKKRLPSINTGIPRTTQ